ncbi:asparagine synthase-related protein [Sphingomonas sp.]|uniref:asparagine synthase-related protein n=1 Tax=Sphingomonas sp. TaxID=28214 RepID=UPI001B23A656|nr:asparagine synthase-related protein [Sphingomonas sp.]MBO9711747.1 hypothetical protein [Sphingomonas sp.]
MTILLGGVHRRQIPADWKRGFAGLVAKASGEPSSWFDRHAILVQHAVPTTPEDVGGALPLILGRGAAAFDGRIDNRHPLIEALALPPGAGAAPDGDLLAAAWERWGAEAPRHLLGDFAIAAWDGVDRRLTLACDQTTGGRPIFWYAGADHILFANDLAVLLAVPGVPRNPDMAAIEGFAGGNWPSDGRTFFQHIRQIPPGGRLSWCDGTARADRYWQLDWAKQLHLRRDGDYVEAGRELLDRAVAAHARVARPLVCQLSGGLDSSAVVATAARLAPGTQLHALTAVPEPGAPLPPMPRGIFFDEATPATATADHYPNVAPHHIPAEPIAREDLDPTAIFATTALPQRSLLDLSWFAPLHRRGAEIGARTVLVGHAGNLTLSHSGLHHLRDLLWAGRLRALWQEAAALDRSRGGSSVWRLLRQSALPPLLPPWLRPAANAIRGRQDAALEEFFRDMPSPAKARGEARSATLQHLVPLFRNTLEGRRIANIGRRRRFGTETRDPLGYLPLLEFCLAVPQEQYLRGGELRSLARRMLADRLPPAVVNEQRKGRQCPEYRHRAAGARLWIGEELALLGDSALAPQLVNLPALDAFVGPWSRDMDAATDPVRLRKALLALHIGQYLRWIERDCPGLPTWTG